MPGPKGNVPAIYAQVVTSDKRQSFHWDASALWYKMQDGRVWAPLSIVVHLCDGPATILGPAPSPIFQQVLKFSKTLDPQVLADTMTQVLNEVEELFDDARPLRSVAGQCVAFHPGEQIHAGAGHDNIPDPVTKGWNGRVVAYFFAYPENVKLSRANKALLCHETPWGLMREGITKEMVSLVLLEQKIKTFIGMTKKKKQLSPNLHNFF